MRQVLGELTVSKASKATRIDVVGGAEERKKEPRWADGKRSRTRLDTL